MRSYIIVLGSSFVFAVSSTAFAQVEGTSVDDGAPAASPSPAQSSKPADPAAPQAKNAGPSGNAATSETAPAQDRPATAETTTNGELDHRFELGVRVGVLFPKQISPKNWLYYEVDASPMISIDPEWILHKYVALGAYFTVAPISGVRGPTTTYKSDASGLIVSGGFAAKARFEIGDSLILRGGLNLGRNAVSYSGKTGGSDFEASGGGFNVGLVADGVWRASKRFGVSSQLGFLTQLGGSADVKGPPTAETGGKKERDFDMPPIFFLTVGPELFL